MRRLGLLGGVMVIGLAACQSKETAQQTQARMQKESAAFGQTVAALTKRWQAWIAAGQADSIAALFTEQGREMPPNEAAVVGRAAIKHFEAGNAAMFDAKLTIRSEAAVANGPLGVDRGSYTFEGKAKRGAPKGTPAGVKDEGKYLAHWENVNGQWQIVELTWNPNRPPLTAGAAKPKASTTKKATTTTKKKK
jgi:ketosteroid isomerase-like protein